MRVELKPRYMVVSHRMDQCFVFNLFFKAEPFVAILIAYGTYGHTKELVLWVLLRPGGQKFDAEG